MFPLSEKGIEQIKKVAVFIKEHLRLESSAKYQSYLREIHGKKGASAESAEGAKGSQTSELLASGESLRRPDFELPDLLLFIHQI